MSDISPELQAQLDSLLKGQAETKNRLENSQKENDDLKKQINILSGNGNIQGQLDAIFKNQEEANTRLEDTARENAELKKQLAILSGTGDDEAKDDTPKIPEETFKIGKKTYRFTVAKMIIPGIGDRTALEILTDTKKNSEIGDKTILQYLVDIKSGAIKEVVE